MKCSCAWPRKVREEVPEAHFLVIGDGPRRCELETLSAQLGLAQCVHFVGKRPDVPELLNLLDVFVLTSRMEANPVSILEALACGKPVVATRVGSIPETVIDGQCGYLVDPDDDAEMARRVAELLLDPAQARRFGAAGRQHVVENWSVDRMVAGYEELLESLYRRKTAVALTLSGLGRQFHRGKRAGFVRTVAKRLVLRLPAAAQRNHRFVRRQRERIALVIQQRELALDQHRTVGAQANGDRHGSVECGVWNAECRGRQRTIIHLLARAVNHRVSVTYQHRSGPPPFWAPETARFPISACPGL